MKLKTLKDLKPRKSRNTECKWGFKKGKDISKQEAIKWVKLAVKLENIAIDKEDWKSVSYHAGFQKALKIFHNITEEDLK